MSAMSHRPLRLVRSNPGDAVTNAAVSHAMLRRISDGLEPETLRLYRPERIVAFGPMDRVTPGYRDAVSAARDRGFAAIERLSGGRAAVFHEQTLAFAWSVRDPDPRLRIRERFGEVASLLVAAFVSLGVDARVGEVPGEYCPGEHSVNARGRTKLAGLGQRVVAHAAHLGGVVVVSRSDLVRDVLVPVYDRLGLGWNPATAGALADERPSVTWEEAESAVLAAFGSRHELWEEEVFSPGTLDLAATLAERHAIGEPQASPSPGG